MDHIIKKENSQSINSWPTLCFGPSSRKNRSDSDSLLVVLLYEMIHAAQARPSWPTHPRDWLRVFAALTLSRPSVGMLCMEHFERLRSGRIGLALGARCTAMSEPARFITLLGQKIFQVLHREHVTLGSLLCCLALKRMQHAIMVLLTMPTHLSKLGAF